MDHDFSHLNVEFYVKARKNKRESAEKGRPIFDEVEMIKFRIAGDPKTVHEAPAHDQSSVRDPVTRERLTYAQLHAAPYEAFKRKQEFAGSGTVLSAAPFLGPAKVQELKALNIFTVEQLAALDGANLQRIGMGARPLKEQAIAYLEEASHNEDASKLAETNAELMERIAVLEARMAEGPSTTLDDEVSIGPSDQPNPFSDWDKDTLKLWMSEQGGEWDGRWSVDRARQEASKRNDEITAAQKAA